MVGMTRIDKNPRTGGNAVEVRGLVKHYGETKALDGVDLDVREGTVLGVLGPNGAGKTTLVRCLSTLITPDAGHGHGRRLRRGEAAPAAAPHHRPHRPVRLGRREALRLGEPLHDRAAARPVPQGRPHAAPTSCWSASRSPRPPSGPRCTYSGGMRRRLDLAASMIGSPAVLYLDEPTTGLDPRTRNEVWDEVQRMVADGATVLLTTQYMEEAEQLANELTVIDQRQGHRQRRGRRAEGEGRRPHPADPARRDPAQLPAHGRGARRGRASTGSPARRSTRTRALLLRPDPQRRAADRRGRRCSAARGFAIAAHRHRTAQPGRGVPVPSPARRPRRP